MKSNILFRFSGSGCLVFPVIFFLSCPCYPVLILLSLVSYPDCPVLPARPLPTVLPWLSCQYCPAPAILSWLFEGSCDTPLVFKLEMCEGGQWYYSCFLSRICESGCAPSLVSFLKAGRVTFILVLLITLILLGWP
jgi:hypothetical protein